MSSLKLYLAQLNRTMYDPGRALITKVCEKRNIRPAIHSRITPAFFDDVADRDVWEWIVGRYERLGKVPSVGLLTTHFPDFEPEEADDDLDLIIETVKEKRLYADLQVSMKKVVAASKGDPMEALEALKTEASNLAVKHSKTGTIDLTKAADLIRKKVRRLERMKGMLGIPWPWECLNDSTRGALKGGYYAFYGDPGTMKTWLLIFILDYMHRYEGARPLFITQEMPAEDIMMRWAALRVGVDYADWQKGELSKKEKRRLERELDLLTEDPPFVLDELDSSGASAIVEIAAKIEEYDVTVCGIDGLGDLSSDAEWGSWWNVNKGLKRVLKKHRIPGIGTHHTNRDRRKSKKYDAAKDKDAQDVALGEALFRYTDGLFRVARTPQNEDCDEIQVHSKKVREGKPCHFTIHARPAFDFSQKRVEGERGEIGDDYDDEAE